MEWSDVCREKQLHNLPYKIELNEWGNIVMSPASNRHGNIQSKIAFFLMTLMSEGTVLTECAVETSKGVKVADVVWASAEFLERNRGTTPYIEAPEICVEIRSPSNSDREMFEKKDLYFAKGTREYWLCDEEGRIVFYNHRGEMNGSGIYPKMPRSVEVDA